MDSGPALTPVVTDVEVADLLGGQIDTHELLAGVDGRATRRARVVAAGLGNEGITRMSESIRRRELDIGRVRVRLKAQERLHSRRWSTLASED